MREEYKELLPFCQTDRQREVVELLASGVSLRAAAKQIGISVSNVCMALKRAREYKEKAGQFRDAKQHINNVPPAYNIKGTSTFYNLETGEPVRQWVKTDLDRDAKLEALLNAIKGTVEDIKPLPRVKAPKKHSDKNLMVVYPLGDPHIGMYAWSAETGEDFDCNIAENNLRNAMRHLVEKTPDSETAIIINLGDFFHSDNQSNRTARAGNSLDVDTRWSRVLMIGVQLMIDCINMALERHKRVIVKNNIGNHDDHTSQVLSICLMQAYRNNPRVEISNPANAFFCHEFGKNMVVSTHGHMVKPAKMQGVIANYFSEAWGRTEHRYCYLGHFHHEQRIEENGLITEIFNTLASSDAWHHASGYRSKRNMKAIVLHRDYGEIERYTFSLTREALC